MLNGWLRYALAERVWRNDGPAIQATARHVPALERLRFEVCAMVSLRHTAPGGRGHGSSSAAIGKFVAQAARNASN